MGMAVGNNLIKRNRGERQLSWLPRKVTPLLSGCIPHPYSNRVTDPTFPASIIVGGAYPKPN